MSNRSTVYGSFSKKLKLHEEKEREQKEAKTFFAKASVKALVEQASQANSQSL